MVMSSVVNYHLDSVIHKLCIIYNMQNKQKIYKNSKWQYLKFSVKSVYLSFLWSTV